MKEWEKETYRQNSNEIKAEKSEIRKKKKTYFRT